MRLLVEVFGYTLDVTLGRNEQASEPERVEHDNTAALIENAGGDQDYDEHIGYVHSGFGFTKG